MAMSWKSVCRIDDLCQQGMQEFTVDGVRILLIRAKDKLFAIPPLCPHMEEPLMDGLCDGTVLTCLKHLWQWELETGGPLGEAEVPLLQYEVKIDQDGTLFVQIEKELIYDYK